MIPHRLHTIRGPNTGTGTSSDHGSALKIARWWHCQQHTSERPHAVRAHIAELPGSPADFEKLSADETEKWGNAVKFAGLSKRLMPVPASSETWCRRKSE
jgi:hypothetical protein